MKTYKELLAGVLIALGSYANMKLGGVEGAILFSLGLLTVIHFRLPLFTGRVSTLGEYNKPLDLLEMLLYNAVGTSFFAIPVLLLGQESLDASFILAKLDKSAAQILFDAFLCGACVSIAAKSKDKLLTVLSVALFVLCGGEHCIADHFYFCAVQMEGAQNFAALGVFFLAIIGNTMGGLIMSLIDVD